MLRCPSKPKDPPQEAEVPPLGLRLGREPVPDGVADGSSLQKRAFRQARAEGHGDPGDGCSVTSQAQSLRGAVSLRAGKAEGSLEKVRS